MPTPNLIVCKDPDALAARAADFILQAGQEAIRQRGRFTFVLTGGSTPEKTYAQLAQPERAPALDWSKTYVFVGDERFVPFDDPRSNFGMARRTLLSRVPVPPANLLPMPTAAANPADGAAAYAAELARFFGAAPGSPPPRFDLLLLGLGDDGHVASLFPGAPSLRVTDTWVTWSPPGTLPPPVDRITLTFPVLNAARAVAFLVAGDKKAPAVRAALEEHPDRERIPAAGVQPVEGTLTWLLDEAAAGLLQQRYDRA